MPKKYAAQLAGPWSDYYKLDTTVAHKLEYVTLKNAGIKIIAEKYRAQYGFNIVVDDYYGFGYATSNFLARLKLQLDSLQEGEIRGMVFNSTLPNGDLAHSTPYIATKLEGKIIVVDFEKRFPLNSLECNVRQAKSEYLGLQADLASCGVFAINTIKNCLKDREFLTQLHDGTVATKPMPEPQPAKKVQSEDGSDLSEEESDDDKEEKDESELEIVNLKKVMGQRTKIIKTLSQEQKDKYVHELQDMCDLGQLKNFNLKAFYKGHDYARIINPDHLSLLDEDSASMVLKIDGIRKEINFDDVDLPDLGDTTKKLTSAANPKTSRLLNDQNSQTHHSL